MVTGKSDDYPGVDNHLFESLQQILGTNIGAQIDPYLRAAEIRSEDPKIKNGDISKLTGKEWREASPVFKDAYRRKAEDIKRDTGSMAKPNDLLASPYFECQ
ncbi:hypothetical protein SYNPS1DRAFT_25290 [Syncephalis pseudoplumigaleata]|uniref:HMG box domain-containing protein n=1 Tax=Syncephalis pseudoplumigaleata TaxID=1712513 RepID=A0A4P9YSZ4_9FUNG|nr:hypothetical protein SYNPS1DRAFT_25290 [Syncephalis pseudoplumigaleata]|eukprot:RKP22818.1 hypothetical protein SYNPS1DRAFT_25290 [Syncephalis pseudoplumigaleata]